jgi:malate dehydrogenase (oxaloacetate-decarboxylating)
LGLTGRLPAAVLTLDEQADRVWHQLQGMATDLGRNLLLEQLHYRHELLYYKVLEDHLPELMPVVYTPTVGEAIQRFSEEYRGQRGLFLSIDEPDEIAEAFETFGLGPDDVDLIVCTDAEAILGIGDWGVGGIQIAVGKLALYTAGAGIDPRRCIAVSLDVGTDNEQLLQDPFYVGNRHARLRGAEYDAFMKRYIETAHQLFPHAILHFEDFGPLNAAGSCRPTATITACSTTTSRAPARWWWPPCTADAMSPVCRCATRKRSSSGPGPPASASPIRSATR